MRRCALALWFVFGVPAFAAPWTEVTPAAGTCWDGTPWRFWYREGETDRLAVWFQGGGACWKTELCDPKGAPTFDGSVTADDAPARSTGLLDATNELNPLAGWHIVFLPYCTGDMHIGRRSLDYTRADGSTFNFAHEGARNTRAALDWVKRSLARPLGVLVTGESAGAIAAAFWTTEIGDRFPEAELVTIADAAGGYRALGVNGLLQRWGVLDELPRLEAYRDKSKVYFESFYLAAAERHPDARLTQVNFSDDAVQRHFLDLLGSPVEELTKPLTCNMNEIRIDAPQFHSFIYPGQDHVMLRTPAVYTTSCRGVRLVDWIGDVIEGTPVENTWCEGAENALTRPRPRL